MEHCCKSEKCGYPCQNYSREPNDDQVLEFSHFTPFEKKTLGNGVLIPSRYS